MTKQECQNLKPGDVVRWTLTAGVGTHDMHNGSKWILVRCGAGDARYYAMAWYGTFIGGCVYHGKECGGGEGPNGRIYIDDRIQSWELCDDFDSWVESVRHDPAAYEARAD